MLASADRNGGITIWDPENGQEVYTLAGHKSAVTSLSWRGDSKLLASSSEDGAVKLWEMEMGKQAKTWNAHSGGVLWASYIHDGRIVTCGRDNQIVTWDGSGSKQKSMQYSGELPLRATFSHDGERVFATDFNGRLIAWNTKDGKQLRELDTNPVSLSQQLKNARQELQRLQETKAPAEKIEIAKALVAKLSAARSQTNIIQQSKL